MKNFVIYNELTAQALTNAELLKALKSQYEHEARIHEAADAADNAHDWITFQKLEAEALTVEDNIIYLQRAADARALAY